MSTTSQTARPFGYIGLGNMGAPMAERLLDWPAGLVVCDTRADAVQPFVERGATAAAAPRDVASAAAVVSVTVLDDEQVREVVDGPDGLLRTARRGSVIAVHSTIGDETAVELAQRCRIHDVEFVDAPVSGGAPGAKRGELAVMVGGSPAAFDLVREPFEQFAGLVVHAGPVGAGTRMKLARNLLHFVAFAAAGEAQRLAAKSGLDITELGKVVRHTDAITGGPGAIMLRDNVDPVSEDDFWYPILRHVRDLGEKDLRLALDLAGRLDVELPLAGRALGALAEGLGVEIGAEAKQMSGKVAR